MKPQKIRLVMVWLLVAAFCFSLFPLNFAGLSASAMQSSAPRRNKNGSSTANPSSQPQNNETAVEKQSAKPDSEKATRAEVVKGSEQEKQQVKAPEDNSTNQATDSESNKDETQNDTQQRKRKPLPFDRPPVTSQPNSTAKQPADFDRPNSTSQKPAPNDSTVSKPSPQTSTNNPTSSNRPGVSVQKPSAQNPSSNPESRRYPSNPSTADSGSNSTGRNTPPVLKRGDDLPNSNTNSIPADRQRGVPPVLQRPGQEQPNPVWKQTPRGSESSDPNSSSSPNPSRPTAGNNGTAQTGDDDVLKLESTMVSIPILVSDRSNRYIPQLNKRDFLLYEDGTQQEIAHFGNEEVPFSVALVLDFSPSVAGSQDAIQDAAIDFVRQLRPQDRVMVVSFAKNVDFLTDFTNDRNTLERAIRSTSTENGTSVYEAVYRVVERMRNVDGRKALILFSDGEDTTSRNIDYNDAINAVTEADVLAYGLRYPANGGGGGGRGGGYSWPRNIPNIGLPIPLPFPFPFPRRRRGPLMPNSPNSPSTTQFPRRGGGGGDFMTDIATAGGGAVYDALQVGDMRGLAYKIAEELRHVYVVSYYPTNPLSTGGYRNIRVRVKNRDDIAVRHRRGYYAKDQNKGSKI